MTSCPVVEIRDADDVSVLIADGTTLDASGVAWTVTALDGWWDSAALRSHSEEMQPSGEQITMVRANARAIVLELVGHGVDVPSAPLGSTKCIDALDAALAAFHCQYVAYTMRVDDGGSLGVLHAAVRRSQPLRSRIIGQQFGVRVQASLLAADPLLYDESAVGHD